MQATTFLREVEQSAVSEAGAVRFLQSSGLPDVWVRWLGGFAFELLRDFQLEVDGDRRIIIIAGFEFDGASVPRPVWRFIAPVELGVVSPLVHDHLYRTGGQRGQFSRKDADKLFARHMAAEGIPWWRRKAAYLAVRVGGGGSWRG